MKLRPTGPLIAGFLIALSHVCVADDAVLLSIPLKPQISVMNLPKAEAWGYIDLTGRVVVPPTWSYAEPFWHGCALVIRNGNWGMINGTGKILLTPQWDQIFGWLPDGRVAVKKDGKCGFIDANQEPLKPFLWDDMAVEFPSEGLSRVWQNKKVGFMDEAGAVVIEPQWDAAADFTDGLAMVVRDKREGFIDHSGKLVIDFQWDYDSDDGNFSAGLAAVKLNGKWGFIDKTGRVVLAPQWDHARSFSKGLAQVEKDKKWGFIDPTGHEAVATRWDYACLFSEGLSMVEANEQWGFVDTTGRTVIAPQFKSGTPFSEGLAAVEVGGRVGFIDKSGLTVIQPIWDLTPGGSSDVAFSEGLAKISKDGHVGLIDKTGKVVIAPEWDRLDRQAHYYNGGCYALRFADRSFTVPNSGELNRDLNGLVTPLMEARMKLWQDYQAAEAAWFDHDGRMIWHSPP